MSLMNIVSHASSVRVVKLFREKSNLVLSGLVV